MQNLMAFQNFLMENKTYKPEQIKEVLDAVKPFFELAYTNRKLKYYDIPCSFDIETSSFMIEDEKGNKEKAACMYVWMFGIYGIVLVGRTWEEYVQLINTLSEELKLNYEGLRLIVYVHNLAYEFQFMRLWFEWLKVFAVKTRTPLYAITNNAIEYRCSYLLSGYSLEKVGEHLHKYKVKKLVGHLDYEKIRHSETPLTADELAYCVNDVKVVMAYIAECIEDSGKITKIPLTKTGYVRNYCRNMCFGDPKDKDTYKRLRYADIMKNLVLEPDEYEQLKRAFQGGFTHANSFYTKKTVENVTSYDFTSSYPTVMVAERFPMSRSEKVDIKSKEELEENLKYYCCLFDLELIGLKPRFVYENPLSRSRCWIIEHPEVNNGRVVKADRVVTTVTEQDYLILKKFYKWDSMRVANFRRYIRGYLPSDLVAAILKLYSDKTQLKGVSGKEVEYQKSKEMLNSVYGAAVTDIVRENSVYIDNNWKPAHPDLETKIIKYNDNAARFLYYPWGVWITAYARRNLFTGIYEFGKDYIYSDTDSIKGVNAESHADYINKYNRMIREKLIRAMEYHQFDINAIEPETINGEKKCLGVWDYDGNYSRFKTLGAKRYMVEYSDDERNPKNKHGEISLTVSGLNKKTCIPWMLEKYGKNNIFDSFNDKLYVDPDYTGKMIHTYIDEQKPGTVVDYTGKIGKYNDKSVIHLSKADYTLKLSKEYADFLAGIEESSIS